MYILIDANHVQITEEGQCLQAMQKYLYSILLT
jgi:hypothetical protein